MQLKNIANYVTERISSEYVSLGNYITTDNLLPDKQGRTIATNLPPQICSLTKYAKGDILIANIRPYLKKIWMADVEGGASNDVLVFRAKEGYSCKYLYAVLLQDSFYDWVMKAPRGSQMPRGDKDHIMQFGIIDVGEAHNVIGELLSNLDRKIALNRQINANLEALARQLYDYWFVQFDFPDANGKPYKSSDGKMVYNPQLKREIPKDWEVKKIGDILGRVKTTPKLVTDEYLEKGKYPIIDQTSDVYFAGFTDREDAILDQYPVVVFGDHSCAVKYINFPFVRGADGTQILLPNDNKISAEYLYFAVNDIRIVKGYARHFSFLKESLVIVPEQSVASAFKDMAQNWFKSITQHRLESLSLTRQRDELLPLLMNGQVTVE